MTAPILVIGNKRYSSWSLRPWLLLRHNGVDFREERVSLYQGSYKDEILRRSPAGKVPALIDDGLVVWESIAICEYAVERFDLALGWPRDRALRATARSICAEMHAGFAALRTHCTMNVARTPSPVALPEAAEADVARVLAIWNDALARSGGPFLFGDFSIADAFYAPVAIRFDRYALFGARAEPAARAWVERVLALPAMREWVDAGIAETERLPQFEK
jgi:glutathione S-transferase